MPDDTALPVMRQRPTRTSRHILGGTIGVGHQPIRSLYVHVPFCAHKCHYCDFYSFVDNRGRQRAFAERLAREFDAIAPRAGTLDTIFIGGGTPTLLEPEPLGLVLDGIRSAFDLADGAEWTTECNPETATPELMTALAAAGVNRISIGAQSFNPSHLRTLERHHDPANVAKAVELAAAAGIGHRSVDLIFAIPRQTIEELDDDLDRVFALEIDHLSAYSLTYEPNTAMTKRLERGEFIPATDSLEADMFLHVRRRAAEAGFDAYEISNFAKPGGGCRHNLAYWRQDEWLAAGPSASGHAGGHRYKNVPRLDDYLAIDDAGFAPVIDHEPPDPSRLLVERLMTGLRLAEGLDAERMLQACEAAAPDRSGELLAQVNAASDRGWLETSAGRWILTDRGVLLADGIAAELMAAVSG
ncbi:MAG: radical SAM family heme chaperone HemW [Planctomycetota bacterium]